MPIQSAASWARQAYTEPLASRSSFFPLWFSLLMGDAQNVGWILVSALNPLVLANAGCHLRGAPKAEQVMAGDD